MAVGGNILGVETPMNFTSHLSVSTLKISGTDGILRYRHGYVTLCSRVL